MSVDFQAFGYHTVLDSLQKRVEALETFNGKGFVSFSDGTLFILEPDAASPKAPWQVLQALKGFGKKTLLQLKV